MINVFTLHGKIQQIQKDVLCPMYTVYPDYEIRDHSELLKTTGWAIKAHKDYIEELCNSRLIAAIFAIVKYLGGADQLTSEDFDRFTGYVKEGGLNAMIAMLLDDDKMKIFVDEIKRLPLNIQQNAPAMLKKAEKLHRDFIFTFFRQNHYRVNLTPKKLYDNFLKSEEFIKVLIILAEQNRIRLHESNN